MSVGFFGSEVHYLDHLLAVERDGPSDWWWTDTRHDPRLRDATVVVAAHKDLIAARKAGARHVLLMEHGVGQSYSNRHSSYPGGVGHHHASMVLAPNEQAAERHHRFYAKIPVEVIGCPKLDRWLPAPLKERADVPLVVISFHWRCKVAREAGTVWDDYGVEALIALGELHRHGQVRVGVHAHPRLADEVAGEVDRLVSESVLPADLGFVASFDAVVERADLYVCDNSSTLFEFAALDRPVVVMNSPRWRRNVHHGGRFWEWASVGIQADTPVEVTQAVQRAIHDDESCQQARRNVVAEVYPHQGSAARRAIAAIAAWEAA